MGRSLVSVIVPVYNAEKYLEKCLNSIADQSFKDIEIICVNDGSTDNSLNILKDFSQKDERFVVLDIPNSGPGGARNKALKAITAPYIMFVDSDDWLEAGAVDFFYNAITANDCDIVIGTASNFAETDNEIPRTDSFKRHYDSLLRKDGVYPNCEPFNKWRTSPWGKIYKKEIFDLHEIKSPENLANSDEAMHWCYMAWVDKIFFTDKPLYNRLVRSTSIMSLRDEKGIGTADLAFILDYIYEYLNKNGIFEQYKEHFELLFNIHSPKILRRCVDADNCSYEKAYKTLCNLSAKAKIKKPKKILKIPFTDKIFSIKNRYDRKTICVLGMKFSMKRKKTGRKPFRALTDIIKSVFKKKYKN